MSGRSLVAVTHLAMLRHDVGDAHPERPERLEAAIRALRGLGDAVSWRVARPAPVELVQRVHDEDYLAFLAAARRRSIVFDPDTRTCPESVDAAWLAAGAVVDAVDAVIDGPDRRAWALVRPPGHHAERDRAMGFCFLANVAIGAERARDRGIERVLIVDWDVHHGNGTQHIFEGRADVLFFSSHQGFGFYPGTGAAEEHGVGEGEGFTIDVPLRPGQGDAAIIEAFEQILVPAADAFRPGIVLVSAGFDAHRDDPLGGLAVTDAGYARLARIVRGIADRWSEGRLVLALEGGYDLDVIERCVRVCGEAMLDEG